MSHSPFSVAMVLAAGRGERMRPLSDVLPKPALPLPEGPVIASPLRLAAETGIRKVVINACHLADLLVETVAGLEFDDMEILLSREMGLMGTAGGLALARDRDLLGDEGPVLVLNGDGVLGLDVDSLIAHHNQGENLVTLALLPHLAPERWSRVMLDAAEQVNHILPPGSPKAREAPFLYPGVMAVSRAALESLPSTAGEIPDRLWRPAQEAGRLGGVVVPGHWREVGTPADYLEVVLQRLSGKYAIHPSAEVHPSAFVEAAFVGRNAVLEAGARVVASVVAEGAIVRRGARIARSILLGTVEVCADEDVTEEVRTESR
ncbi:MAG: sugar phosphate nucleotidyltransferase [Thermoanaerobaculales bacterium]